MAQEYYNLERTAELLKITPGEVNRMREQSQLRAFRDGSDWKFKKEDVEDALAKKLKSQNESGLPQEEEEDFLSFGSNDEEDMPTMMADTIATEHPGSVNLEDDGLDFDGLDLVDESDDGLSLVESDTDSEPTEPQVDLTESGDDSATFKVDLAGEPGPALEEDDDMVLGGSSDLSLSHDSGISLADDDENGYAVAEAGDDGLEIDEDSDILALADTDEDSDVATLLAADADKNSFDLEANPSEFEESDSSSQVIALDGPFGEIGESEFGSSEFEDPNDFGTAPAADIAQPVFGGQADFTSQPAPTTSRAPSPYEPTYSGLAIGLGMVPCILLLGLAGMMMFDLVRNMGSWGNSYVLTSPIMEPIASMLGLR